MEAQKIGFNLCKSSSAVIQGEMTMGFLHCMVNIHSRYLMSDEAMS